MMKNLTKKALALLLSAIMVVMSVSAVFAETGAEPASAPSANEAVEFFSSLGVIDESEIDGGNISRGEFIDLLMAAMNHPYNHVSPAHKFNDVAAEQSWFENVGRAYQLGFISGYTDYQFSPNDDILMSHALTVLRRALNVSQDGILHDNADFITMESEFSKVAASVDTSKMYLTDLDALKLFYRMLMIDVTVGVVNLGYTKEDKLLSVLWDAYKLTGKVTAIPFTAIDTAVGSSADSVEIDGNEYKITADGYVDLLGYTVNAYVKRGEDNTRGTVISIAPAPGKNSILELDSSMLPDNCFDGKYLYYSTEDSSMLKKAKVSSTVSVIYNGAFAGAQVENELFDIALGEMVLIDSDYDSIYDVIKIEEYSTIVAEQAVSFTQSIVFDKFDKTQKLYFNDSEYENIVELYFDGVLGEPTDILADDLINYYTTISGGYRYTKAYVCRETVVGELVAKSNKKFTIGEREIRPSKHYRDEKYITRGDIPTVGAHGTFILNYMGEVEVFERKKDENEHSGILIKIFSEDVDLETFLVRIYTTGMDIVNYAAAKNLTIDGEKARTSQAATDLLLDTKISAYDNNAELLCQLVNYELDENGNLLKIFTSSGTDARAPKLEYDFERRYFQTTGGSWYGGAYRDFRIDPETQFFCLPTLDAEGNLPVEEMFIAEYDGLPNGTTVTCAAYSVGENRIAEQVVYLYDYDNNIVGTTPKIYLVEDNNITVNDEGELVRSLVLWTQGTKFTYQTEDLACGDGIEPGDAINIVLDNEQVIRYINRAYTLQSEIIKQGVISGSTTNYRDANRIVSGYATATMDSYVRMTYDPTQSSDPTADPFDCYWNVGSVTCSKFNVRTGTVERITSSDMGDYISKNQGKDYLFLVREQNGVMQDCYVYELEGR